MAKLIVTAHAAGYNLAERYRTALAEMLTLLTGQSTHPDQEPNPTPPGPATVPNPYDWIVRFNPIRQYHGIITDQAEQHHMPDLTGQLRIEYSHPPHNQPTAQAAADHYTLMLATAHKTEERAKHKWQDKALDDWITAHQILDAHDDWSECWPLPHECPATILYNLADQP